MVGDSAVLQDLISGSNETVIFGDGSKGNVVGKGTLNATGLPEVKNMMIVEGLKS